MEYWYVPVIRVRYVAYKKMKCAAPDCCTIAVTELNVTTTVSKYMGSIKEPGSVYDILDTWGRPLADRGTLPMEQL